MWHQKQNNEIVPGRVMGPFRSQDPREGNIKVPAPSDISERDFLSESSRKRKAVGMDYPDNATSGEKSNSQSVLGNPWLNESDQQHKLGVLASTNEQGNTTRGFSNQTPPSLESDVKVFQPGRYQSQGLYSYSLNSQINENNFPNVEAEKRNNLHSTTQPHAFHQKGPSNLIKSQAGKIPTLPDSQSISYNFFNQIEAHKHHYFEPVDTSMEKGLSGHGSVDGMNFGHINHILKANLSTDLPSKISELFSSSEVPQLNHEVFKQDSNLVERILNKGILKTGPSFETKPNFQALDVARTTGISAVRTSSLETARHEGNVAEQSFQNYNSEVRTGCPLNDGVTSQVKPRDQNDVNHDTQIMEGSNMENGNHSLGEDVSPKKSDDPTHVPTGIGDNSQHVARKLDGKAKSDAEKVAPTTEKLWDGSLQLSASVTVSAVAFFKSGEKAPEVKWSKSIVVKGKVRLEAFERYIQELPRSRSRGLMVTSLCWRVGSSKTGLAGMKEVAKGYKEREKVGFAQLSRGIDLYVCPRSDAIITILAKYGFFKGMAALEEDQDSLIGCVVWRRNHPTPDPATKKSKNKISPLSDQPVNSTSNSVISLTEKDNTPFTDSGERVSALVSKNSSAPLDIPGSTSIQSSEVQIEIGNSTSTISPEKTHLAPRSSPAISMGLNSAILSASCSLNSHMSREVETPIIRSSGPEKAHAGLELPKPVRPLSPRTVTTENRPAPGGDYDDDDLPEFDFGTACGISQHSVGKNISPSTSTHVSDVPLAMKVPAEEAKNIGGLMPSTLPAAQPVAIASHQISHAMAFPVVSSVNQPSNLANSFGEGEPHRPTLPLGDEKPMGHGNERSTTSMAVQVRKNLWDDDDDMPEWCPPDLEHQSQPAMMSTTRLSIPCVPSPVPNPNSDNKLPGPPPLMATTRVSSSYIPPLVPNRKSENIPPGPPPPPPMATSRPSSSYIQSPTLNRKSENMLPGPPPGPPPTMATSKPSISFKPSPVPNRKSENILPGPPPLLPLPPPPPPPPVSIRPQFQSQGLSHGYQNSVTTSVEAVQIRPVGGHAPIGPDFSLGFTYNSTPRPQGNMFDVRLPIRPASWRGWNP